MKTRVGWAVGLALGLAVPSLGWAQTPSASRNGFQPPFQAKEKPTNHEPIPPALPGAEPTPDEAAHAEGPIDLPPTDALFDAINRGDIVEARDALSRGADLQGHNVLGMTPIALSVDLARNDITFLLLSYHGAGASVPETGRPAASAGAVAKTGRQTRASATVARPGVDGTAAVAASTAHIPRGSRTAPTPATAAIIPSGQPGTPVPQAGFLGFGG